MAMNVGSDSGEDEVNATIKHHAARRRVMLVLLIIFLITIPVVTQSLNVTLPQETNIPRQTKPENIEISVNKDGDVFWNLQHIPDSNVLVERLKRSPCSTRSRGAHPRAIRKPLRVGRLRRHPFACQRAGILKICGAPSPNLPKG